MSIETNAGRFWKLSVDSSELDSSAVHLSSRPKRWQQPSCPPELLSSLRNFFGWHPHCPADRDKRGAESDLNSGHIRQHYEASDKMGLEFQRRQQLPHSALHAISH